MSENNRIPWKKPFDAAEEWGASAVTRQPPTVQPSMRFAGAYAELQSTAAQLRPSTGAIPDVDLLEPLIHWPNELTSFCQARVEAVRVLAEEERRD